MRCNLTKHHAIKSPFLFTHLHKLKKSANCRNYHGTKHIVAVDPGGVERLDLLTTPVIKRSVLYDTKHLVTKRLIYILLAYLFLKQEIHFKKSTMKLVQTYKKQP